MTYAIKLTKYAGEVLKIPFDFTAALNEEFGAPSISSAAATATVFSGTDATPSAILGARTISSPNVVQTITGGVVGVTYTVKVTATFNNTSPGGALQGPSVRTHSTQVTILPAQP